jgi:hypothetical protein
LKKRILAQPYELWQLASEGEKKQPFGFPFGS